jgi:hypothetical protein
MMHSNDFVLCIKHKGKVLRESNKSVFLPFNSEYQIYIKNLNHDRKGIVKVEIDGMDISNDQEFVINPNDTITLERFMLDGDLKQGKKFKFVKASNPNVTDPQNNDNGNIKVTCWLEKQSTFSPTITWTNTREFKHPTFITYDSDNTAGNPIFYTSNNTIYNSSMQTTGHLESIEEQGATIEGSNSYQQFHTVKTGKKDWSTHTVLILQLKPHKKVKTVHNTRFKYCPRCGQKQKYNNNFCPNCGHHQVEM